MPRLALETPRPFGPAADMKPEEGPGFVGKLPCKGDFVARRLPRDFRDCWERWLDAVLSYSRGLLGDDWQDIYLTSPVWRFALASGVCGGRAAVGVVLPSVDRVGRCYPLAAVAMIEGCPAVQSLVHAEPAWFDAIEAQLFDALEEDAELDRVDAKISAVGFPPVGDSRRDDRVSREEASGGDRALPWRGALADLTDIPRAARCCFWGLGSQRIAPSVVAAADLPDANLFAALLDGQWAGHGWRDAGSGR